MKELPLKLVFLGATLLASMILGILIAFIMPKLQVSMTMVAIKRELPAAAGLGSLEQVDIRRDNELQGVMQWLGSETVQSRVAEMVPNYTTEDLRTGVELKNEPGLGFIEMTVAARTQEDAVRLAEGMLEQMRTMELERRNALVDKVIAAVQEEVNKCEQSFIKLSLAVRAKADQKGMLLSEEKPRQEASVALLQQYQRQLLDIEVERSKLRSEFDQHSKEAPTQVATDIFDRDPTRRDYVMAAAQQQVMTLEAELGALKSRYGAQHHQVIAAQHRLDQARVQLKDLNERQKVQVERQLDGNAAALQAVQDGFSRAKQEMLSQDILHDPEMAALVNARDVAAKEHASLKQRLTELRVYRNLQDSAFEVVSGPFPDAKRNLKVMIGCVFACMVIGGSGGLVACLRGSSRRLRPRV